MDMDVRYGVAGHGSVQGVSSIGTEVTPPDAGRLISALRQIGYSLEQAVSDLVDNALNANATCILIRFFHDRNTIQSVLIMDNGHGMTGTELREAMRFGSMKSIDPKSLGKFGMGLKLASLSHARSMSVITRRNRRTYGRRWSIEGIGRGWRCDVLRSAQASAKLGKEHGCIDTSDSGTGVFWEQIDKLSVSSRGLRSTLRDLQRRLEVHIGLHFHRFLESGRIRVFLDQQIDGEVQHGIRVQVKPLDPFSYPASGSKDYPKNFRIRLDGVDVVEAQAHIWPPNSEDPEYRLGQKAAARQGFYFYRNDRLIQAGGWNGLLHHESEPHLSLARIRIELPTSLDSSFGLNVQKSAVIVPPGFIPAVEAAESDNGDRFDSFRTRAQLVYRNQDVRAEKALPLTPAKGLPVKLQAAAREILHPDYEAFREVDFVWETLPHLQLFDLDIDAKKILINSRYRTRLLDNRSVSGADCPLLKMLLFFLVERDLNLERMKTERKRRLHRLNALLTQVLTSVA